MKNLNYKLPPAARGTLFEKTAPLDPPQKLFIIKSFWESRTLFSKRVLAAGGIAPQTRR